MKEYKYSSTENTAQQLQVTNKWFVYDMVFIVTLVGDKNEINCGKNKDITKKAIFWEVLLLTGQRSRVGTGEQMRLSAD